MLNSKKLALANHTKVALFHSGYELDIQFDDPAHFLETFENNESSFERIPNNSEIGPE